MSKSKRETYLDEIDPYEFEALVADVWEEYSWETTVTSCSQDRGIDGVAQRENPTKQKILIQAKAHDTENESGVKRFKNT